MHEIGVLPLHGVVQHYDWGGHDFIPGLLGIANSDRRPFAELWMGAHPKVPGNGGCRGYCDAPGPRHRGSTRQNPWSVGQCPFRRTSAFS
jgi:hypothetical protein